MWKLIRRRTIDMTYGDSPCPRAHYNLNNNPIIRRARLLNVRTPYPPAHPKPYLNLHPRFTNDFVLSLSNFPSFSLFFRTQHDVTKKSRFTNLLRNLRRFFTNPRFTPPSLPFWNGIENLIALRFRDLPPEVLLLWRRLLKKKKTS